MNYVGAFQLCPGYKFAEGKAGKMRGNKGRQGKRETRTCQLKSLVESEKSTGFPVQGFPDLPFHTAHCLEDHTRFLFIERCFGTLLLTRRFISTSCNNGWMSNWSSGWAFSCICCVQEWENVLFSINTRTATTQCLSIQLSSLCFSSWKRT